jgi:hypothetical protein
VSGLRNARHGLAVELARGRLVMPPHGPILRGVLQLIGGHEPTQHALEGISPAAGKLKPHLLLLFLQRAGRHGQRLGAAIFGDIELADFDVVDDYRELIVFIVEARSAEPIAQCQHGGAGGPVGRPAMPQPMRHQPVGQFLGFGRFRRYLFERQQIQGAQLRRRATGAKRTTGKPYRRGAIVAISRIRHVEVALGE